MKKDQRELKNQHIMSHQLL